MHNHNYNKILKSDWLSTILISVEWDSTRHTKVKGNFSNDDDDGNENVKKAFALISKTTISHMQYFFFGTLPCRPWQPGLKISLCGVLWRTYRHTQSGMFLSFSKLGCGHKISTPGKFTNTNSTLSGLE